MKAHTLHRWCWIHRWSSLACTLFLLILCITGLPLVFEQEITRWLEPPASPPSALANLDDVAQISRARYPGQAIIAVFLDDDSNELVVRMAPRVDDPPRAVHRLRFDAATGALVGDDPNDHPRVAPALLLIRRLHTDLFMGLGGELLLAAMALLFVLALVSGVALYGPFVNKRPFGSVRRERSRRIRWLDLHNLLGIVLLGWMTVVGATGLMNELARPMFALWQRTDVAAMLRSWSTQASPGSGELASVQAVYAAARRALPGMELLSIAFPSVEDGTPDQYVVWMHGDRTLTSRLFEPVLVDAHDGRLIGIAPMPWYLRALEVSRPLHFGDYGRLPLKILWALLDLITIVILLSGLYLWLARQRSHVRRPASDEAASR